jgi:polysaccharide biosynthesis protein PslJ
MIATRETTRRTGLRLPAGWPVMAMFVFFPLWWVLGVGAFIFPILALPMFTSLLLRARFRAPRGYWLWIAFCVWVLGSATMLDDPGSGIVFVYRASLYIGAGIAFLFVYNLSERELPTGKVVWALALFWMFAVACGFLAILVPEGGFTTLMERIVPAGFLSNDWVYQLVHPSFAQVHDFLGYPVGRPTAPFVYTNEWASAMGTLVPLVIASWSYVRRPSWKPITMVFLVAAFLPMVVSLNRGLWLSLSFGLLYAAWRFALRGRGRAFGGVLCFFAVAAALVALTPLRQLVEDRVETGHSNEARAALAEEATQGALESPLLGHGSPRASTGSANRAAVGTQGQLWMVMFSHGLPGLAFFLGWWCYVFWASRGGGSPARFWAHVSIFIVLLQLPYYGMLPTQVYIVMVAAAIALREGRPRARPGAAPEAIPAIRGI